MGNKKKIVDIFNLTLEIEHFVHSMQKEKNELEIDFLVNKLDEWLNKNEAVLRFSDNSIKVIEILKDSILKYEKGVDKSHLEVEKYCLFIVLGFYALQEVISKAIYDLVRDRFVSRRVAYNSFNDVMLQEFIRNKKNG
jgi:hypothetical protein